MSKRAKHARCSVIDCTEEHSSLHRPPASEETRAKWIRFIYRGYAPRIHPSKNLLVCSNHFAADSFSNLGQYNAGLAGKLFLKEGAVPTVRGKAPDEGNVKHPQVTSTHAVRHVASQTDPIVRRTDIHLLTNAQKRFRSTGTQTKVPSKDCGVCTITFPMDSPILFLQPTKVRKQPKRPRLLRNDEEEGPSACS